MGCFKTPSLRNLANRGRYMHDGSFPTVKDALAHYIGGGNWNPRLDKGIHSLDRLTFDERNDLLTFLGALNGKLPDNIGPPPDLAHQFHHRQIALECGGLFTLSVLAKGRRFCDVIRTAKTHVVFRISGVSS